jgi:hypothetical protein
MLAAYAHFASAARAPEQGTYITCEECVILYPEKYADTPEKCPVCRGKKEHFQPARMMDGPLADVEARELELDIENELLETVMEATREPVTVDRLKEIRSLYMRKLKFNLVHGRFERDPIVHHIREIDKLIEEQS